MAKFFNWKSDDFKERFEERFEVEAPSDRSSSQPNPEKPLVPYDVHTQGPLTYFNCYFEDLKRPRPTVQPPPAPLFSRSLLLKGLICLALSAAVFGVGFVLVQNFYKQSQSLPKVG